MVIKFEQNKTRFAYRFILEPNCSLSWRGTVLFFAATSILVLSIALLFALHGLWMVLPFAGLELIVLGVGLYITSLRVHQYEVISVEKHSVMVEKGRSRSCKALRLQRLWARVFLHFPPVRYHPSRLVITSRGLEVEIGGFLSETERVELAHRLKSLFQIPAGRFSAEFKG